MNRLLVALLSVFDAVIAAAVGVAIALAPLTLLFVLAFGGGADWGALWPAGAAIWQLGHLVPQTITLPGDYLAATGIGAEAASFTLSLAPLAFALFTAVFAARSGARAAHADAWVTGVLASTLTFAALAAAVAWTAGSSIVTPAPLWQGMLYPTLVFAVPALLGALVVEWREAGAGAIARLRDRVEALGGGWSAVPAEAARGAAVACAAIVGLGALGVTVSLVLGGGQVVALYEAAHVDLLGATVLTLGQLAYLPTLVIWSVAFLAGPGFAVGTGTSVSAAGTQLGVVPGIPVLGAIPQSPSSWLLLLALLPVAAGALAGWIVRSRLAVQAEPEPVAAPTTAASTAPWATAALDGLIGPPAAQEPDEPFADEPDPVGPRIVLTLLIALLTGAVAGLLALLAGGSLGPGRLAEIGPQAGPVALAVGLEVLLGAGILLLAPGRRSRGGDADDLDDRARDEPSAAFADTSPLPPLRSEADAARPADPVTSRWDPAKPLDIAEPSQAVDHPTEPVALPPLPTPSPDDEPSSPAPRRPSALPPVD